MSKQQQFRDYVNEKLAAAALDIFRRYEKTLADCHGEPCSFREKGLAMLEQQLFRDYVNQRLAVTALDICRQYEKTIADGQGESCRSWEKSGALTLGIQQKIFNLCRSREKSAALGPREKITNLGVQPEIQLNRTNVQQPTEPLQIKEERELWSNQDGQQSDTTDSIFTSPRVTPRPRRDPEHLPELPPLNRTPIVENRDGDFSPANETEKQIKAESDEEEYTCFVLPYGPTAQSSEEDEEARERILPELTSVESKRTQAEYYRQIPNPCSSLGPWPRNKTSPDPWTRPIPSSCTSGDGGVISQEVEHKSTQKLYKCGICGHAFSRRGTLVRHERIHTEEKPYQCEDCDKSFTQKCSLVTHRRIHTGDKLYQCDECGHAFSQKATLVTHKRVHTGDKPYRCEECGKTFSHKSNLITHRRIHSGEKPYQCEECDRAFNHKVGLVKHRKSHIIEAMSV